MHSLSLFSLSFSISIPLFGSFDKKSRTLWHYSLLVFEVEQVSTMTKHQFNLLPWFPWQSLIYVTPLANIYLQRRYLPKIYLFAETIFCEQDVDYRGKNMPETLKDWFAARNIPDDESFAKIPSTRIKVVYSTL